MGSSCSAANCAQLCGANTNVRDPSAVHRINDAVEKALVSNKANNRTIHLKNVEPSERLTPAQEGAVIHENHQTFQGYQTKEPEVELYAKKLQSEQEEAAEKFASPKDDQNPTRPTTRVIEARQSSFEDQTQAKTATQLIEAVRQNSYDDQSQPKTATQMLETTHKELDNQTLTHTPLLPSPVETGEAHKYVNQEEQPKLVTITQLTEAKNPQAMPLESEQLIQTTMGLETRKELPLLVLENGAKYQGQWKNGVKDGYGVQYWTDGSRYEGEWKNNKAHGRGTLYHADGDIYDGEWLNDKANGHGTYTHTNNTKYIGEWKDDRQHGYGVETWPDGTKYQGEYSEGKKHGEGKLTFGDGACYEGIFDHNDIHSFGKYTWSDGRTYEGSYVKNKMQGKGKMTWPDGRSYEGEYLNDKKHGHGVFRWADGREYVGQWKEGKQDGKGVYTNPEGKARAGIWENGKRMNWIKTDNEKSHTEDF